MSNEKYRINVLQPFSTAIMPGWGVSVETIDYSGGSVWPGYSWGHSCEPDKCEYCHRTAKDGDRTCQGCGAPL